MINRVKLGEVLDIKRGASLCGDFYSTQGEYIRLTLGNFNYPNGGFKENTAKDDIYFLGKVRKEFILNKGDIITPLTEQAAGLLGETALIPESNKYIQSGDVGLVLPKRGKLDSSFCYYLLSSQSIKKQLGAAAQQTKIRHTSPDKIKDCIAFIPEIVQQEKIGKILLSIDKQIQRNNEMVQKLPLINHAAFFSKGGTTYVC
ncbi:MAG TPA: restriction endonuclease subunit S [Bacilli bacterium]|nr:restriction endonuclease subunit S [Bacilli bacterium]